MRRLSRIPAVMLAALAAVGIAGMSSASSVQTKPVAISKTQSAKATFGPIPANFPPAGVGHTPPNCGHPLGTNRFQATCDNVPIHIEDPQLGPTEDYLVTVKVTWEPNQDLQGQEGANDLDVYLYDDRQLRTRKDETCAKATSGKDGASCFTLVGQSAGATQPEEFKLFSPEPLGDYNLVVVNFVGPNISYTIEGNMKVEGFDAPFEDLGPSFVGRSNRSGGANTEGDKPGAFVAPVDLSGDEPPSAGGGGDGTSLSNVGGILAGGRSLDEVPVLPDADFTGLGGKTVPNEFGAPAFSGPGATRNIGAVGPVSSVLVFFWLVVVPVALLGVGVFVLLRRRRRAFSFG
ncbi:MAG TPA: hypothetical protein VM143_17915 [Acidimicrobiales bacterium]|nr:hypothetical protein [Acidimicrobiales bacterium]